MGNRRSQLIQDYEDAKLALVLDEYSEVFGKLSTEQYKKDAAEGRLPPISEQELDEKLKLILQRAEEDEKKRKKPKINTKLEIVLRKVATAAASIAIFFLLMVTVQAAGIDVFGAVGRWTDDLFHFEHRSDDVGIVKNDSANPITQIQKTMINHGISNDLVPTWLPDGCSIVDISFLENDNAKSIVFLLEDSSDNWILIQADSYISGVLWGAEWVEKDNDNVEEVIENGKLFYIFKNNDVWTSVFQSDNIRLTIADGNNKTELIQIIQSIGALRND